MFSSYPNRSPERRSLTEDELLVVRENYKIKALSDDVQTYYDNEVMNLIIETDYLIRFTLAKDFHKEDYPKFHDFLTDVYHSIKKGIDPVKSLELIDESTYKKWDTDEVKILFEAYLMKDLGEEEVQNFLVNTRLGLYQHAIVESLYRAKKNKYCCVAFTGCTFCPFNRGLKHKDREEVIKLQMID